MRWLWIDSIVELIPGERIVAVKNISLAEEHLHDHFPPSDSRPALPVMPASLIIEGMAQTAGILVGHASAFAHNVILAKVSRASLLADAFPGHTLRFHASITQRSDAGASTTGRIERIAHTRDAATATIGLVDLVFSHLDNPAAADRLPDHNFVFGESFKTLLRSSGLTA